MFSNRTESQLFHGDTSDCRNPSIQTIFQMIGAGEKAGSGGLLIHQTWNNSEWKTPSIKQDLEHNHTTLILSFENLWPSEVLDKLKVKFHNFEILSTHEKTAVVVAQIEGKVSHYDLREKIKIHPRDLTLMLQKLVKGGYLVNPSSNRKSRYEVGIGAPQLSLNLSNSDNKETNSDNKETNSDNKETNSDNKETNSEALLLEISGLVASKRRSSRRDVEATILKLCQIRPLTMGELSELLDRSPGGLRQQYIKAMLNTGRLKRLYPQQKNHPRQAYLAND